MNKLISTKIMIQYYINGLLFVGIEFDNSYSIVFTNNNGNKMNSSYHLLNTESTEKQHVCQGNF